MDLHDLEGKSLALLLAARAADGEDEVMITLGRIAVEDGRAYLDRGKAHERFWIRPEWYDLIEPVIEEDEDEDDKDGEQIRKLANRADYYLPLSVGNLSDDPDPVDGYMEMD